MPAIVDRTGRRYGRLTALQREANSGSRARWSCRCDCGRVVVVLASALGLSTVSCGCYGTERRRAKGRNVTHGMSATPTYRTWSAMRKRCTNPADQAFHNYGGRGITVCARWQRFEAFLEDMGEAPPGMEIDRRDVDGGYHPDNCRWATPIQQANNKRNNQVLPDGRTVAELARDEEIKYATAYYRHVIRGNALARMHVEEGPKLEWD